MPEKAGIDNQLSPERSSGILIDKTIMLIILSREYLLEKVLYCCYNTIRYSRLFQRISVSL